jgi:GT2 family glycosyltransferase
MDNSRHDLNERPSRVAAIILNWNAWRDTMRCIDSLLQSSHPLSSIVIVDNGSYDRSVERLIEELSRKHDLGVMQTRSIFIQGQQVISYESQGNPKAILISYPVNTGVAGGRNIGLERALWDNNIDHLFIIDNDAEILPQTIVVCLETMYKAKAAVVGCLIKNFDDSIQFAGLNFRQNIFYLDILMHRSLYRQREYFWEADLITGCASLVSRQALENMKRQDGFIIDPFFFLYAEDQDFCLRLKRLGYRIVIARDAVVYHKISKGGVGSPTAYYYSSRNRFFLAQRYLPIILKTLFLMYYPIYRLMRAVFNVLKGSNAMAWAQIEGLKDGFLGIRGKWKKHS